MFSPRSRLQPWLGRTLVLALCLAPPAVVMSCESTAAAQSDGETEVARQRFLEGVRHYDQKDFDKARLAFLQAYLLKPHPAVLLNLAQSELRAGRFADAAQNFAKYVRENPGAEAMSHAKAAFEEARDKVGEVSLEVNTTGALVNVDGTDVGKSPLTYPIYLMPGRHTLRATKGGLSADESLEAVAGQRVYVTLALPEGSRMGAAPAVAAGSTSNAPVEEKPLLSSSAPAQPGQDGQNSPGFFSWLGDSPGAIALVSVGGLALGTSAVLAAFANNRYSAANDARDQIMGALQDNVNSGVLVGTAVPCGDDGIASRNDSFDSRVAPKDQAYLESAFANACQRFTERSDSGDDLKTMSLISLGVGVFATVGTVVWYFADTGGGGDSAKASGGGDNAKANGKGQRARLTPVLTPGLSGLWLDVAF
jgi:hypothetical protein